MNRTVSRRLERLEVRRSRFEGPFDLDPNPARRPGKGVYGCALARNRQADDPC